MVMVTKVYKPNFKLMVEELEWTWGNFKFMIWTLDETYVFSMANKTYNLWEWSGC
jgi:hypothetical protein